LTDITSTGAYDGDIRQFAVQIGSSAAHTGTILIDNLTVANGITPIPEPSTYAFAIGIFALGAGLVIHRRKKS
jgi:hypothetical protein